MKNFSRDNRGGRRDLNRPKRRDSERSGFEKEMHEVTCDGCGERCKVPFRPTEGKPVYCNDCFKSGGRSESKKPNQFKKEFEQINSKLDEILDILESD